MDTNATASSPVITEEQVEPSELLEQLRCNDAKTARKNNSGTLTHKKYKMNELMSDQAKEELLTKGKEELRRQKETLDF